MDFAVLWAMEICYVPLGIVLILFSLVCTSAVAVAASASPAIASELSNTNPILVAIIGVLGTCLCGLVGWLIIDRVGWAGRARQVDINTGKIADIERKINGYVPNPPSRQEYDDLKAIVGKLATTDYIDLAIQKMLEKMGGIYVSKGECLLIHQSNLIPLSEHEEIKARLKLVEKVVKVSG
jgi:hypothetical protein